MTPACVGCYNRLTMLEFRILGPLEVRERVGRQIKLGGPPQRALLVALLLRAGRVVPIEQLVDVALRRGAAEDGDDIAPERRSSRSARRSGPTSWSPDRPGYALQVATPDQVDASPIRGCSWRTRASCVARRASSAARRGARPLEGPTVGRLHLRRLRPAPQTAPRGASPSERQRIESTSSLTDRPRPSPNSNRSSRSIHYASGCVSC